MAIQGRTYVPPIIVRDNPASFATVANPVTLVQRTDPPARIWFKSPDPFLSRSNPATFATVGQPPAIVYTPVNKTQLIPPPVIVRAPDIPVAAATSTPPPVIAVPPSQRPLVASPFLSRTSLEDTKGIQPIISAISTRPQNAAALLTRGSLEDFTTPVGRQPLVITSPQRPGLTTPAILTRSNPATFATIPGTAPLVVVQQVPPIRLQGFVLTRFPRGNFVPSPVLKDVIWCADSPTTGWGAEDLFQTWYADEPATEWSALTPEADCP